MSQDAINQLNIQYPRPWGHYQTIAQSEGFQVKEIWVNPGQKLSLQSHEHRSEHWIVVRGQATVTVDETTKDYAVNQAIYIPKQSKHRLANHTESTVIIIEVQVGDYLGEDDITRFDDIYDRT